VKLLTDEELEELIRKALRGRQNAAKRALIVDARAALGGSVMLRQRLSERVTVTLRIPQHLVDAIESYLTTDWSDGRDPSKIGALNAVAYIGEQVARIYKARQS
jgi:hypothetical protein